MATYRIEWEDDRFDCETPLEAAQDCYEAIRDGQALCFTVTHEETGHRWTVDLNETEGDEVIAITSDPHQ